MRQCHDAIPPGIASWQREHGEVTELNVPNDERIGLTPGRVVVEKLRAALRGPLMGPADPSCEEMIDRRVGAGEEGVLRNATMAGWARAVF
jgi:hypothetical protein